MILLDSIFIGIYLLLKVTIYWKTPNRAHMTGLNLKEHSYFISSFAHGLNAFNLSRVFGHYLGININWYHAMGNVGIVFILLYLIYFRYNRFDHHVEKNHTTLKSVISILISILYLGFVFYFTWKAGDFVRGLN